MSSTERVLSLLGLFQSRPVWTAPELAQRLGVTDRTVRRDVDRLRELGYTIGADRGHGGGYRLERGQVTPPLLLTDDEAVSVALALRTAGSSALAGDQESALRALVKLEHVLPARARARVERLGRAIDTGSPPALDPTPVDVLMLLADCTAGRFQARLDYVDRRGAATERRVEPYRLVAWRRRWYLSAYDLDRDDWRTFRLDRVREARATTFRFRPRSGEPDVSGTLGSHHDPAAYRHLVDLLVQAPIDELEAYAPYATLEAVDARTTRMVSGADDPVLAARWLLGMPEPVTVVGDETVREAVAGLAARVTSLLG